MISCRCWSVMGLGADPIAKTFISILLAETVKPTPAQRRCDTFCHVVNDTINVIYAKSGNQECSEYVMHSNGQADLSETGAYPLGRLPGIDVAQAIIRM